MSVSSSARRIFGIVLAQSRPATAAAPVPSSISRMPGKQRVNPVELAGIGGAAMDNSVFRGIVGDKAISAVLRSGDPPSMQQVQDELDPPFETLEPDEWRGPAVFNSP